MLNHTDALLGYYQEAVSNHVLGSDPFNGENLVRRMIRNDYARPDYVTMAGISALEIAC